MLASRDVWVSFAVLETLFQFGNPDLSVKQCNLSVICRNPDLVRGIKCLVRRYRVSCKKVRSVQGTKWPRYKVSKVLSVQGTKCPNQGTKCPKSLGTLQRYEVSLGTKWQRFKIKVS